MIARSWRTNTIEPDGFEPSRETGPRGVSGLTSKVRCAGWMPECPPGSKAAALCDLLDGLSVATSGHCPKMPASVAAEIKRAQEQRNRASGPSRRGSVHGDVMSSLPKSRPPQLCGYCNSNCPCGAYEIDCEQDGSRCCGPGASLCRRNPENRDQNLPICVHAPFSARWILKTGA